MELEAAQGGGEAWTTAVVGQRQEEEEVFEQYFRSRGRSVPSARKNYRRSSICRTLFRLSFAILIGSELFLLSLRLFHQPQPRQDRGGMYSDSCIAVPSIMVKEVSPVPREETQVIEQAVPSTSK